MNSERSIFQCCEEANIWPLKFIRNYTEWNNKDDTSPSLVNSVQYMYKGIVCTLLDINHLSIEYSTSSLYIKS